MAMKFATVILKLALPLTDIREQNNVTLSVQPLMPVFQQNPAETIPLTASKSATARHVLVQQRTDIPEQNHVTLSVQVLTPV